MSKIVTLAQDQVNYNVKHPLQHEWVLWYDKPSKGADWEQNLQQVASFDTVEDFWGVFNNIALASQIIPSSNYHLFKKGIKPMWEDAANKVGGRWVYQSFKKDREALACIGEIFEYADEINGIVVSPRVKNDKIAIWTKTADNRDACMSIGYVDLI